MANRLIPPRRRLNPGSRLGVGDIAIVWDGRIGHVLSVRPWTERPYHVEFGSGEEAERAHFSDWDAQPYTEKHASQHFHRVLKFGPAGFVGPTPAASALRGEWRDGRFHVCGWPEEGISDDLVSVPQCIGAACVGDYACTCPAEPKAKVVAWLRETRMARIGTMYRKDHWLHRLEHLWGVR